MPTLLIAVRRSLWVVLLTAAGGATYSWWRDRGDAAPSGPAEWPPLTNDNAERDITQPMARPGWVDALDDGSCPLDHPIKANAKSGIFHLPDGRSYARTNAERCYSTAEAAVADGYRQAKN